MTPEHILEMNRKAKNGEISFQEYREFSKKLQEFRTNESPLTNPTLDVVSRFDEDNNIQEVNK